MFAPGREVPTEDSERTEERHVHHTEEYREQSWQHQRMEGTAYERWI